MDSFPKEVGIVTGEAADPLIILIKWNAGKLELRDLNTNFPTEEALKPPMTGGNIYWGKHLYMLSPVSFLHLSTFQVRALG